MPVNNKYSTTTTVTKNVCLCALEKSVLQGNNSHHAIVTLLTSTRIFFLFAWIVLSRKSRKNFKNHRRFTTRAEKRTVKSKSLDSMPRWTINFKEIRCVIFLRSTTFRTATLRFKSKHSFRRKFNSVHSSFFTIFFRSPKLTENPNKTRTLHVTQVNLNRSKTCILTTICRDCSSHTRCEYMSKQNICEWNSGTSTTKK